MRNRLDLVFPQNFKPQTTVSLEIHKGIGSGGRHVAKCCFVCHNRIRFKHMLISDAVSFIELECT